MVQLDIRTTQRTEFVAVTDRVQSAVEESGVQDGLCILYVPHTTAAVTINENADPSVQADIISALKKIIPDSWPYKHLEGNSPAHIKASLIGSSVAIIIEGGDLVLGTWQGIFFCEFDGPRNRRVYVKVIAG